jgi:hypothetical protein
LNNLYSLEVLVVRGAVVVVVGVVVFVGAKNDEKNEKQLNLDKNKKIKNTFKI